ncbi:Peroxisome biosynthesis protein pex1 [Orbilia oligospora]|nr:Peroxisome biosynthesis protein pex1 [Orbilia oligospora]KAF3251248.1 Peroxisome biosynthesis protein pex1 [Orbilia oligospora]KAF3256183.1 Peroxisome biosynthesis protein pex1 [Orbilia oligospora]
MASSQRRGPTTKTPAVVGLTALRNCLVNLPSGLVSVLVSSNTPAQNVVVELSWRVKAPPQAGPLTGPATITRQAFAGWTGMPSKRQPLQPQGAGSFPGSQRSNSLEGCVEIDSAFARNVGLTEGSKVNILLHVDPPTTHTIHIEPLTASDWEIIELHATFLELNLLSQIRAITFAHPLTVYLSPTSTASIKVARIEPEDAASAFGFAKIAPNAEVIVAPKTRQRRMSHQGKSVKAKSLASTRHGKRRDDGSGPSGGGPVFFRAISLPHESFDAAEEQKGAYCVYLDPEVLAIPALRGCAFVDVVVVRPPGLAPPPDANQANNDVAGSTSPDAPEVIKPSLKIVAKLLPWKNAPDLKHIAISNLLADALDIKNVVGCVIRIEAAHQQLPKGSTTKVIIRPYSAGTLSSSAASEQSSLRWSGKDWKSDLAVRRVKEVLSQKTVWGEDILGGPLSDRLVLPAIPDSPLFAGGILLLDGSEVKHGWILGGDRKYILELGSEITTSRPHVPLSISETALPVLPPGSIVGVDKAINTASNILTRSASVLLTGARGSGKTSLVSVITSILKKKHFFHVLPISCSKFADERLQTIKDTFSRAIAEAKWFSPTVIVFDDLDRLIPAEVEHADSTRSRYIAEAFGKAIRDLKSSVLGPGNVVILATVQAKESVNSLIVGGHIFREIITLKAPNKAGRRQVLEQAVGGLSDEKSSPDTSSIRVKNPAALTNGPEPTLKIEKGLELLDIAGMTDGYMPADLQLLVGRARHEAIVRAVESGSDDAEADLVLAKKDFDKAIKGFVPAGLRGVKLQTSGAAWKDIGGLTETRKILLETLEWPTRYAPIFANCPLRLRSGLLLYGYPGCGKTLLASAVAGECGLNFISVKGPEILNKYIGASEKSVRDLFERASAAKPCVLFFDEFDSIAPKRGHDSTGVTDRVVNQMLTQMDGAEGLDGVYVLAATSRPDLIDPALLRPGRLDKSLLCDLPNLEDRVDILRALSLKLKIEESIGLEDIANLTEGYSGADLQAVLYNAHLEAIHDVIASQDEEVERFGNGGKGKGKVDAGSGNDTIDYIAFSMGNKDSTGEPSTQSLTNGTQAARTRFAERAAVMAKLDKLKKIVQGDAAKQVQQQQSQTNQAQEEEKGDDEPVISWKHLQSSLKSTRPSIAPDERKRLFRIYNEFIVGRSGEMPSGQSSTEIGGRSSLM